MLTTAFLIVAIVLFVLAAFNIGDGRLTNAGLASLTLAILLGTGVV